MFFLPFSRIPIGLRLSEKTSISCLYWQRLNDNRFFQMKTCTDRNNMSGVTLKGVETPTKCRVGKDEYSGEDNISIRTSAGV